MNHTDTPSAAEVIRHALCAERGGRHENAVLRLFDTIDSTNSEAKRTAREDRAPLVILSREQTGGRGRLGRSFHSPTDSGMYLTVSYSTDAPLTEAVSVTAAAAVASVSAIEELSDRRPGIKWVNDIYLHDAKAGGILTEAVTVPGCPTRMVVGIGINLTTTHFPDGLRAPATSLFEGTDEALSPALLAGTVARYLLDIVEACPDGAFPDGLAGEPCRAVYRAHSLLIGRTVDCFRGSDRFSGLVTGIGEDYALLLTLTTPGPDGEPVGAPLRLSSGEVSVRMQS